MTTITGKHGVVLQYGRHNDYGFILLEGSFGKVKFSEADLSGITIDELSYGQCVKVDFALNERNGKLLASNVVVCGDLKPGGIGCKPSPMAGKALAGGIGKPVLEECRVKFFKDAGYGFASRPCGEDVMIHYQSIDMPGHRTLLSGQTVLVEVYKAEDGRYRASYAKPVFASGEDVIDAISIQQANAMPAVEPIPERRLPQIAKRLASWSGSAEPRRRGEKSRFVGRHPAFA